MIASIQIQTCPCPCPKRGKIVVLFRSVCYEDMHVSVRSFNCMLRDRRARARAKASLIHNLCDPVSLLHILNIVTSSNDVHLHEHATFAIGL
jgi:hypothetical protein